MVDGTLPRKGFCDVCAVAFEAGVGLTERTMDSFSSDRTNLAGLAEFRTFRAASADRNYVIVCMDADRGNGAARTGLHRGRPKPHRFLARATPSTRKASNSHKLSVMSEGR